MANAGKINFVFQNEVTSATTGAELSVKLGYGTINLEISGTATAYSITVEGKSLDDGTWKPISTVNLATLDITNTITEASADGFWQTGLDGLIKFRTNITSISGGNLSIVGRVVD